MRTSVSVLRIAVSAEVYLGLWKFSFSQSASCWSNAGIVFAGGKHVYKRSIQNGTLFYC